MELTSSNRSFGGEQRVFRHRSQVLDCGMNFAFVLPPKTRSDVSPVLWYLSGLTCTHLNVIEKGEYRRAAAERGIIVVVPDTSPRGESIAFETEDWEIGFGASFYVDATRKPYAKHFRMFSYFTNELPQLVAESFPADMLRQGICGHSMGGHGALVLTLRNPGRYISCSAFAPIVEPSKSDLARPAFEKYFQSESEWASYDAIALLDQGCQCPEILVDQGSSGQFLDSLAPWRLADACKRNSVQLKLNMRDGYDHSYYFVSTFMRDHIGWHADRLAS